MERSSKESNRIEALEKQLETAKLEIEYWRLRTIAAERKGKEGKKSLV